MKKSFSLFGMAAASLFCLASLPVLADDKAEPRTQTTEEFIEALKPTEPRTRGLRLGSATQAAAATKPPSNPLEVQFGFNSDQITGSSVGNAEALARALMDSKLKNGRFTVVGHTDAVGSRQSNLQLSQRRAQSVRSFLISRGVQADRLRAVGKGFGELKNQTNPEADENRRVEIKAEN